MDLPMWLLGAIIRGTAFGTPLLWGALGEIYAERAGVVNLGMEGMMILGALGAFATAQITGSPVLGLLVAGAIGGPAPRGRLDRTAGQPVRLRAGAHDVRAGLGRRLGTRVGRGAVGTFAV